MMLSSIKYFSNMIRIIKDRFENNLPYQHLSFSEKSKNNYEWGMDCIDYFIGKLSILDISKRKNAYSWYNGELDEAEFKHITNPLQAEEKKYKGFPAKLKSFSIVTDIINTLITDWRDDPVTYQVKILSEDAVNEYKAMRENLLREAYQEIYVKVVEKGDMSEEEMQQLIQKKVANLPALRAKEMQKALKYIEGEQEVFEKSCKQFKDFLIDGTAVNYLDIVNNDIIYDTVNPLYITLDESSEYGQNGNYAVRILGENGEGMTFSEMHDFFKEDPLTFDEIQKLKDDTWSEGSLFYNPNYTPASMVVFPNMRFPVYHCVWRSYAKKGILTYKDPLTGEEQKIVVPEEYKPDKERGESVQWYWEDEIWEGYRIGMNFERAVYKRIRPYPYLRKKMQRGLSPLPYNSIYFSNRNTKNTSPLKMLLSYQIMAIIVFYNIEKAMANHIGNAMVVYMDEIPAHLQLTGVLYYLKSLNIIVKKRPEAGQSGQASSINMSQMNEILQWADLLNFIEERANRLFGTTSQRKGQVAQSASNGATSMAIQQGQSVSGEMFARFREYQRQTRLGLMDLGRQSWLGGKKKEYLTSNDKEALLEVDGRLLDSEDVGLTVTSNKKDKDSLEVMKNLVQPFAQNQQSPKAIGTILEADSTIELNDKLAEMEEEQMQRMAAAKKEEQEQIIEAQKMQEKLEESKRLHEIAMKELEHTHKIDFARFEHLLENSKLNTDNGELMKSIREGDIKKYTENVKAAASMYNADTNLKIAKENKTKYDK